MIKVKGFQGTPLARFYENHLLTISLALTVAPAELEGLLMSHPDILDAGVIGVTAADGVTELPKAFIVPRGGIEQFDDPGRRSMFEQEIATWVGEQASHGPSGSRRTRFSPFVGSDDRFPPTRDCRGAVIWWSPYREGQFVIAVSSSCSQSINRFLSSLSPCSPSGKILRRTLREQ